MAKHVGERSLTTRSQRRWVPQGVGFMGWRYTQVLYTLLPSRWSTVLIVATRTRLFNSCGLGVALQAAVVVIGVGRVLRATGRSPSQTLSTAGTNVPSSMTRRLNIVGMGDEPLDMEMAGFERGNELVGSGIGDGLYQDLATRIANGRYALGGSPIAHAERVAAMLRAANSPPTLDNAAKRVNPSEHHPVLEAHAQAWPMGSAGRARLSCFTLNSHPRTSEHAGGIAVSAVGQDDGWRTGIDAVTTTAIGLTNRTLGGPTCPTAPWFNAHEHKRDGWFVGWRAIAAKLTSRHGAWVAAKSSGTERMAIAASPVSTNRW